MKRYIDFLLVVLVLCSCSDKSNPREKAAFIFYPKKVTSVWFGIKKKHLMEINGYANVNYEFTLGKDILKSDSFVL
jgi:hypothetical protein